MTAQSVDWPFMSTAPKQRFVSVCPRYHFYMQAHLRAIFTSNCLQGYFKNKAFSFCWRKPCHGADITVVNKNGIAVSSTIQSWLLGEKECNYADVTVAGSSLSCITSFNVFLSCSFWACGLQLWLKLCKPSFCNTVNNLLWQITMWSCHGDAQWCAKYLHTCYSQDVCTLC